MANRNPVHVLWITDPWETLDHPVDTTLRLIEECLAMGILAYWAPMDSITFCNHRVTVDVCQVLKIGSSRRKEEFVMMPLKSRRIEEFTIIQYRTDPPVTNRYIQPLQLLQSAVRKELAPTIQAPAELLLGSTEKLLGLSTLDIFPETIISCNISRLKDFGMRHGKTVCKPLNSCQSKGVFLLSWSEADVAISTEIVKKKVAKNRLVLLQKFLPEVFSGEKRVFFINGYPYACIRKKPLAGSFLINMDKGSEIEASELNAHERGIAIQLGKLLKNKQIVFAAADMIGSRITDVNYTSPGLVVEAERLLGMNIANHILKAFLSFQPGNVIEKPGD